MAFGDHLKRVAATGVGCLLVDHDMNLVLNTCDRIYVIDFGHQIAEGPPQVVRRDPAVLAAYLGSKHQDVAEDGAGSQPGTSPFDAEALK
jgi:ABC-type branched-subunit amino acid transport system ATPase component